MEHICGAAEAIKSHCSRFASLFTPLLDESSVVGWPELGWMQFLCKHAHSKAENVPDEVSEWQWGGVPLLCLFGDCHQLPPMGRKCRFR
jgi:hypothetical protein